MPAATAALIATVASLGFAAPLSAVSADVLPESARFAPDPPGITDVKVDVTPDNLGILSRGQDLMATVTLTNLSPLAVEAGRIDVYLGEDPLSSRPALDSWLHPSDSSVPLALGASVASISTGFVSTGISTFPVTIPAASLTLPDAGAYQLAAELVLDGSVVSQDRTSVVAGPPPADTVGVATALPMTVPASIDGLLPAELLEQYTGPTGVLTQKLDAVIRRPVAIGLDPRILASIRILGNSAPASAQNWLARLATAPNQVFALQYADADIAVQAQAGIQLLQPTSFEYAIDDALFAERSAPPEAPTPTDPSMDPTSTDPIQASPPGTGPDDGDGPPQRPTVGSLTAWPFTASGIGWPAEGTVTSGDLEVFTDGGVETTILSGENVVTDDSNTTAGAHSTAAGESVLVADEGVTRAFRIAVAAQTNEDWAHAMAELSAQLNLISAERGTERRTLLATLGRDGSELGRLGQTVDALEKLPWMHTSTLNQALAAQPTVDYAVEGNAASPERTAGVSELHARASGIADLSTVVERPELITGEYRADVLALLSTGWLSNPSQWQNQVESSLEASSELLQDVRLGPMSDVLMASGQASIPVTVINDLSLPVMVRVETTPLNARLAVDDDVTAAIEAGSQAKVLVPVTARVANGEVTLRISLYNDDRSVTLDGPEFVSVDVRADWESVGTMILAILVVGFFGFGVWRNISRRRKKAAPEAGQDTDD